MLIKAIGSREHIQSPTPSPTGECDAWALYQHLREKIKRQFYCDDERDPRLDAKSKQSILSNIERLWNTSRGQLLAFKCMELIALNRHMFVQDEEVAALDRMTLRYARDLDAELGPRWDVEKFTHDLIEHRQMYLGFPGVKRFYCGMVKYLESRGQSGRIRASQSEGVGRAIRFSPPHLRSRFAFSCFGTRRRMDSRRVFE